MPRVAMPPCGRSKYRPSVPPRRRVLPAAKPTNSCAKPTLSARAVQTERRMATTASRLQQSSLEQPTKIPKPLHHAETRRAHPQVPTLILHITITMKRRGSRRRFSVPETSVDFHRARSHLVAALPSACVLLQAQPSFLSFSLSQRFSGFFVITNVEESRPATDSRIRKTACLIIGNLAFGVPSATLLFDRKLSRQVAALIVFFCFSREVFTSYLV